MKAIMDSFSKIALFQPWGNNRYFGGAILVDWFSWVKVPFNLIK